MSVTCADVVDLHLCGDGRHEKNSELNVCSCCVLVALHQGYKKKRSRGPLSGFLQVNEAGTPRLVQHHGGLETEETEETQKDKKTLT